MRRRRIRSFGAELRTGSVGGILSRAFHTILNDIGMTEDRYTDLMQRYIARTLQNPNRNKRTAARESLSKELLRETMTWKTFIKGMAFLSVPTFDLVVTLFHANGQKTTHHQTVNMADFSDEHDGIEVGVVLSKLYHGILNDLGITTEKYNALMAKYIAKAHINPNRKDRAAARSSLSKELLKESMTWKTFVKGLTFLQVPKFELRIVATHISKRITSHQLTVALEDLDDTDEHEDRA